jgi:hypothetical protein
MNHPGAVPIFTEVIKKYKWGSYIKIKVSPIGYWPFKHRWIMEQHLGRKLEKHEVVHHIDGNTLNNEIDNLKVMFYKCHSQLHSVINIWSKNYDACIECGTTDKEHHSHGLCENCHARHFRKNRQIMPPTA